MSAATEGFEFFLEKEWSDGPPAVLGGLELILRDEFNMNGVQETMNADAPLMIMNGPYTAKIGLHGGNGCFGPGFRANATIGGAIRLMRFNPGGGIPGAESAMIFATPLRYTACVTENMAANPRASLAVSRSHSPDDDVITCAMMESPRQGLDDVRQEPLRLLPGIADHMVAVGPWNVHARAERVVAMDPKHADVCAKAGVSGSDVQAHLVEIDGCRIRDLDDGGDRRRERALGFPEPADPDDDCFLRAIKHRAAAHPIVAGGWGPCTALCHFWSGGSRPVDDKYAA